MTDKGIAFKYEVDSVKYTTTHKYTVDFTLPNGIWVETKGYFDADDRAKHLAIKRAMQETHDIRFVFMKANTKIHKKSLMTYGDWATKHGFIWAQGSIPDSWYLEEPQK